MMVEFQDTPGEVCGLEGISYICQMDRYSPILARLEGGGVKRYSRACFNSDAPVLRYVSSPPTILRQRRC